ncbi:MAG: hypothetical protein WA913_17330, partial [Pricia sp.]
VLSRETLKPLSLKLPLIYIIDNELISAFDIKIRIYQSELPCRIKSFEDTDSAFKMLCSNYGHEYGPLYLLGFRGA